jgi:hypothetical protein
MKVGSWEPTTVAARSRVRNIFARSDTGIVCSNPTRGTDVCAFILCLCCPVYVAALRRAYPPSKEPSRLCIRLRNWKKRPGPKLGCRTISSSSSRKLNCKDSALIKTAKISNIFLNYGKTKRQVSVCQWQIQTFLSYFMIKLQMVSISRS